MKIKRKSISYLQFSWRKLARLTLCPLGVNASLKYFWCNYGVLLVYELLYSSTYCYIYILNMHIIFCNVWYFIFLFNYVLYNLFRYVPKTYQPKMLNTFVSKIKRLLRAKYKSYKNVQLQNCWHCSRKYLSRSKSTKIYHTNLG